MLCYTKTYTQTMLCSTKCKSFLLKLLAHAKNQIRILIEKLPCLRDYGKEKTNSEPIKSIISGILPQGKPMDHFTPLPLLHN